MESGARPPRVVVPQLEASLRLLGLQHPWPQSARTVRAVGLRGPWDGSSGPHEGPCGSHGPGGDCPDEKVGVLALDLPAHREVVGWAVGSRTPRPDSARSWTPGRLA